MAPHLNVRSLRFVLEEGDVATLRPVIDGHDLLHGARMIMGCNPDDLLSRRRVELLPITGSGHAAIGVCTCGVLGCGAFRVSVRRDGDVVEWGPFPVGQTVTRTYRFGLVAYLDELQAARLLRPYEGRGHRTAREVTRLLMGDPDDKEQPMLPGVTRVDWVSAWPWTSDVVQACVAPGGGDTEIIEFTALPDEDDTAFAERIVEALWRLAWPDM